MSFLSKQLRSVIQWDKPDTETLFYCWSQINDEIKNASKLIIGPGQGCIFVYQGKVEAVITEPGIIELQTSNIPFWTTVKKFMQLFESEFKTGIYYFKTMNIVNQKWGTASKIKYDDPKYKFPVGLTMYGNYTFKVSKPVDFFVNIIGARNYFLLSEMRTFINGRIVQPISDYLAGSKYSYADLDANRDGIADECKNILHKEYDLLGLELLDFRIEGSVFDEDTIRRINRIADVSADAMAADAAGINYTQLQQLEALKNISKNEGMPGMMFGMAIGSAFGSNQVGSGSTIISEDNFLKLKKLKDLLDKNLITQEEYQQKKTEILRDI